MDLLKIQSVVDVGCGVGTWLRAFADTGVGEYLGIDGDYVSHDMLQIPIDRFRAVDLRFPFDLGRKFDLACSLEVAEHLPQTSAQVYVETLVQAAPIVLFSAAIPGQGGMSHVNEQWQLTWAELFAQHGYEPYDYIRPKIYDNPSVEWWYKQNIVLFCASGFAPSRCGSAATAYELDRVHPQVLRNIQAGPHSGKEAIIAIKRGVSVITRKCYERSSAKLYPAQAKIRKSMARWRGSCPTRHGSRNGVF